MVIGDNFLLVENPKTASTSLKNCLLAAGIGKTIMRKHATITEDNFPQINRNRRIVFVRNPWDRMVSGYKHVTRPAFNGNRQAQSFEEWLTDEPWSIQGVDFKRTPQFFWTYRTNRLYRFENLREAVEELSEEFGVPLALPHDNKSPQPGEYRDFYTEKTKEIVRDRFWPDIKKYGYEF